MSIGCRLRRQARKRSQRFSLSVKGADSSLSLRTLRTLRSPDVLLANLPSLYYRLLKTDTKHAHARQSRSCAPRRYAGTGALRQAHSGASHDVPTDCHWRHLAATHHIVQLREHRRKHRHHAAHTSDDDVTLNLKVAVQNISGTGFGGLPTFGNR